MSEEQQKAQTALEILIEAVEVAQNHGIYTIRDSAHIFSAIKFFKPDYASDTEKEIETENTEQTV